MFEGIHFYHMNLNIPANAQRTKKIHEDSDSPPIPTEFTEYYNQHAENVRFLLQGENQILYPHPVTDYARAHFLYLQSFGLLDASPLYFTRRKNYESILLLYTYAGQGELEYENQRYTLSEGSGFLIDCVLPHFYHTTGEHWNHCVLHFYGTDARYLIEKYFSNQSSPIFVCQGQAQFQEKLEQALLASERVCPMREYNASLALGALISFLIEEHEKSSGHAPDYVIYLQRYLENNFTNAFTLDDLARFTNVSKYHLVREFRKYTGFSPIDYLIELRLFRARYLLKNSELTIEMIAALSGFSSYANFLKIFKNRLGQTPAQYRGF